MDRSEGDARLIEAVSDHVERHLGEIEVVMDEKDSPHVHIDLLVVGPSDAIPFRTVVTCGMAERAMPAPDDERDLRRAELFLGLDPDWPVDMDSLHDERWWWPLRLLKRLARFPHAEGTWLWEQHTVGSADDDPLGPGTELCAALVGPALLMPDGFEILDRGPDADPVSFFSAIPLHAAELRLARDKGVDELYDAFSKASVDVLVDPARPSSV